MSDILNGGHSLHTDSNQHMSHGAYQNMLNKEASRATQAMNVQNQMYNTQGQAITANKTYSFLEEWQLYADLIEHRFKDGSDVANNADDPELAYSVMTNASMRERAIEVGLTTTKVVGVFLMGALSISLIPLIIKDTFDAIFISIAIFSMAFGYTYFYQYVFIQTRQFVVGPITRKLFKTMLSGYESYKSTMYLLSAFLFSGLSFVSLMLSPSKDDGFIFMTFFDHLHYIGVEYYLSHVLLFLIANILILKMLEDKHYAKFRELARKHKIEIDMNMSVAADVGLNRLNGMYEKGKFLDEE